MMTTSLDEPEAAAGDGGTRSRLRVAPDAPDAADAAADELLEAQSRLRRLLAVNRSLVVGQSAEDVAQQLVEAACATAGAGYSRLTLRQLNGSAAQVLEQAAEPEQLDLYRRYLEERTSGAAGSDPFPGELSEFSVALQNGDQSLGTLQVLDRKRGGPFTPLTKELLSTLAATATLILDRASQYEQVARRAAWLEAMRRVEKLVITSENELEVWSEIANCLRNLTSSGTVALQVPGDHDDMHVLVAVGSSAELIVGRSYPREESHGWQAMQKGRGHVLPSGAQLPRRRHSLVDPQLIGPVMSVPLVGTSGPRGAVSLVRELGQPAFSDSDLEIVEDFARQATVALEMAEARSAWVRMHDAETRETIARNLHDDVMQRLFAVGLSLQGVAQAEPAAMQRLLERTVQDLDATIVKIRETIFTLRTPG